MSIRDYVSKQASEWIGGIKRFLTFPYGPQDRPSQDYQLVNKHWTVESDSCDKLVVSVSAHTSATVNDIWIDLNRVASIVSTTANYALQSTDMVVLCNASGGVISIALGSVPTHAYRDFYFKKIDSSDNRVIINPNGTETIDGDLIKFLLTQNETLHIAADAVNWYQLSENKDKYITCSNISVSAGTGPASWSVGDVNGFLDGIALSVQEVAATPGFNIWNQFTLYRSPRRIIVRGLYNGTASHLVEVQAYNFSTSTWDLLHTWNSAVVGYMDVVVDIPYASRSNYISSGVTRVRLYHSNNGNASHYFRLDYIAIII